MNKAIKNIFTITALTLTFASTLRCEETQEKLAQHIAYADVVGFKNTYKSFQKWPINERVVTLQALANTTQEIKRALQTELATHGDKVNKTTLTKGLAQTIGGAILFIQSAAISHYTYKSATLAAITDFNNWYNNSSSRKILHTQPFKYMTDTSNSIFSKMVGRHPSENTFIAVNTTYALAGILLSSYAMKNGLQNCKNGWNYKAYIEKQIANIDEINEFIQEQIKLS